MAIPCGFERKIVEICRAFEISYFMVYIAEINSYRSVAISASAVSNTPMSQAIFQRSTRISRPLRRYKSHASAIAPRTSSYPSYLLVVPQPRLIPRKRTFLHASLACPDTINHATRKAGFQLLLQSRLR